MSAFCPYKGLEPFSEEDRDYFFGREEDVETVAANLLTAQLTILYGASGVGKSSLLEAGVTPLIRSFPDTALVTFRKWQGTDFEAVLAAEILTRVKPSLRRGIPRKLDDTAKKLLSSTGSGVAFIFDQFEDYLHYHPQHDSSDFEARLAELVNTSTLDVHFLFALREDALAGLDRFRFRIPTIFANVLRIEHLDRLSAERAIRGPIETYNRDQIFEDRVEIEDDLVEVLLKQVRQGSVVLGSIGEEARDQIPIRNGNRIETPYLQLALTRLWEEDVKSRPRRLRLATLNRLGGAEKIARSHLERVLNSLNQQQQTACLRMFDRLVTPFGEKIAHSLDALAHYAELSKAETQSILEELSKGTNRILRRFETGSHHEQAPHYHYEIYHDVLAEPILHWSERRKLELEVERRQQMAEEEALRYRITALECVDTIEQSAGQVFRLDEIVVRVCEDVRKQGFDFAAIQLIDKEEQTIQTVHGSGLEADWYTIAKHSLRGEQKLLDIQADIALSDPPRIEIIAGQDQRFDRFLFKYFGHKHKVRVFIPIVVIKDNTGLPVKHQFDQFGWDIVERHSDGRNHRVAIAIRKEDLIKKESDHSVEIIGTLEAGYHRPSTEISNECALDLFRSVCRHALELRSASLVNLFEAVASSAKRLVSADAASLHFPFDPQRNRYVYEAWAGMRSASKRPREGGLGDQAILQRLPQYVPDPKKGHSEDFLKIFNPPVYEEGTRALVAVPLLLDDTEEELYLDEHKVVGSISEKRGVLYVAFNSTHWFSDDEIRWFQLFAGRAVDAIRHATHYTRARERARRLANLHNIALSLADKSTSSDLLHDVAGNALNILAADVVTIYEYDPEQKIFPRPPNVAGRLKVFRRTAKGRAGNMSAPSYLLKHGKNIYADDVLESEVLSGFSSIRRQGEKKFVDREGVISAAGVLLRTRGKIVGVMFVNYRQPHHFSAEERWFIERLASTAAIAINNRYLKAA